MHIGRAVAVKAAACALLCACGMSYADRLPVENAGYASLAPGGKQIVFQRKTAQGWRLVVAGADGSGARTIAAAKGNDVEPCWRADGKLIVFSSNRGGQYDLYVVAPDGTGLKRITNTPEDERTPQWSTRPYGIFEPSEITNRTVPGDPADALTPSDLKVLEELANRGSRWPSSHPSSAEPVATYYKILCVRGSGASSKLVTMRGDGSLAQTLPTGISGEHRLPCWSPNAKEIAFAVRVGSQSRIYACDYPVTTDEAMDVKKPKWVPSMDRVKSSLRRIGSTESDLKGIAWAPNGSQVAILTAGAISLLPAKQAVSLMPNNAVDLGFTAQAWGGSWRPDARTAVVTASNGGSLGLETVTLPDSIVDIGELADFSTAPLDEPFVTSEDVLNLGMNSFFAGGQSMKQMFQIYENADYNDLPIFITSDSVLHLNHVLFDYVLRTSESKHMMPEVVALVDKCLAGSVKQYNSLDDDRLKEAALKNTAFFATAAELLLGRVSTGKAVEDKKTAEKEDYLGDDYKRMEKKRDAAEQTAIEGLVGDLDHTVATIPSEARKMVDAELELIAAHSGYAAGPIFGGELSIPQSPDSEAAKITQIDYSQFIPRGHYTRTEILRRYFLATRWLSAPPFLRETEPTTQALLLLAQADDGVMASAEKIDKFTAAFIGNADDQTLADYSLIAEEVFGRRPTTEDLADEGKVKTFMAKISELPGPKLAVVTPPSMRVFPQPYTCDADVMQQMVYDNHAPDVGTWEAPRYFALGLDVMSAFGSERAAEILADSDFNGRIWGRKMKETEYEGYAEAMSSLRERFSSMKPKEWGSNLYNRILYTILPLLEPVEKGPAFMKTKAWQDKSLNAALSAWTELKHDTLPKIPIAVEAGGEGGLTEAPIFGQPVGYVEPSREVYTRALACAEMESSTLAYLGYESSDIEQRLATFQSLLKMIIRLEETQSSGKAFTKQEVQQLRLYGAFFEHLTIITSEDRAQFMADDDMAIVADVSAAYISKMGKALVLEEGVGRAIPILVAVPSGERRRLAVGAIFTHYEFTRDAADRLSDESWRELLDSRDAPKVDAWTSSFITRIKEAWSDGAGGEE